MPQYAFKLVLIDLLRQAQISQNTFMQELTPAERSATGTPELWAAKDHVAHMTFWRQRLVLRLQALLRGTPQPKSEDFEEAYQHRSYLCTRCTKDICLTTASRLKQRAIAERGGGLHCFLGDSLAAVSFERYSPKHK